MNKNLDNIATALEEPLNIQHGSLYSEDLAPVPKEKRAWNTWNYTALWISMRIDLDTFVLNSFVRGKSVFGGYCGPAVKPIALFLFFSSK